MVAMMSPARRFPLWPLIGGLVIALGFLPTLAAPFDFADDGDLVYPAPADTTSLGYVARWWDRVRANVEHLGPFRPTLWAHWELTANTFGGDPLLWRVERLGWCALAAAAFLWLLKELGVPPPAALLAGAAAFWNPYRNEVWVSLTLAEGVAMPYLFAALAAARRASGRRLNGWDALAVGGFVVALGCKNTFAVVVLAMLVLRRPTLGVAAVYLMPLAMPVAHFVYFKLNWHTGQYQTPGPSLGQLGRELSWLKGAAGLDFLAVGIVLALIATWRTRTDERPVAAEAGLDARALIGAALALLVGGLVAYLPLDIMAARYTIPAVWGCDLLLALLLARLLALQPGRLRLVALIAFGVGLAAMAVANVGRQERVMARNKLLWQVVHHLEATAPPAARVQWIADGLGAEEGIHVAWHLRHRGRPDIQIGLHDASGNPIKRVELSTLAGPPMVRVTAGPTSPGWRTDAEFAVGYQIGRKRYACRVESPVGNMPPLDATTVDALKSALRGEGK